MVTVTYVNYTDFNSRKTPKGIDAFHVVSALSDVATISQVIVRDAVSSQFDSIIEKPLLFGSFIPKTLTAITYYGVKSFRSREISQRWFDRRAAACLKKCDVVLLGVPGLPLTLRRAKELGAKVVVLGTSAHPTYVQKIRSEEYKKWSLRVPTQHNVLEDDSARVFLEADMILSRSEYAKKTYVFGGVKASKIKVVGNGIDCSLFSPGKKKKEFRVLFVGNCALLKGLQYLLESMRDIDGKLIVCGKMLYDMDEILEKFSGMKNVVFKGHVDVREEYRMADVYVLPSLTEGSPKTALEAMACGLPVVMFENSGPLICDGKEGFIVKNRDVKGLRDKILKLQNKKLREQMSKRARLLAKKYDWSMYAKGVAKAVVKVVQ